MYTNPYFQNVIAQSNAAAYVIQEQTGDGVEDDTGDETQDGPTSSTNLTDDTTPKKQEE